MSGTFHFELVAPEKKLVSEAVGYVSVPAEEGDIGVLAGHSPLLSSLRMGVVAIRTAGMNDNAPERRYFVAGGFADIGEGHCTILAENASDLSLVDVSALDAEIAALEAAGDNALALEIARAKREAIG